MGQTSYDQSEGNQTFFVRLNVIAGFLSLVRKQIGQPLPSRVRPPIHVRYSWPKGHNHQTFLLAQAVAFQGVNPPFFSGCHSRAILGNIAARQLVMEKRLRAQNGQRSLAA